MCFSTPKAPTIKPTFQAPAPEAIAEAPKVGTKKDEEDTRKKGTAALRVRRSPLGINQTGSGLNI